MNRFPRYSRLIRLYPKPYRDRFRGPMLQTLADMLDNEPRPAKRLGIWLRAGAELPLSLVRQNAIYFGVATMDQMPTYVKQTSLISGLFLVPFVLSLTANLADKVVNNHTLYNSWLWSYPVLLTWVLILPAAALAIALAGYIIFLSRRPRADFLRAMLDLRQSWPVVTIGLMAAAVLMVVLFHDSVHCVVQTPGYIAGHWSQTVSCIRQR